MFPGLLAITLLAQSAAPPRGQIVPDVRCAADPTQSYALYLPSNYAPDREWPVIFGFDPAGRGLNPVERYRDAAEKYGYIVAGSNNSRNGSWQASMAAVSAMTGDVASRFKLGREYVAGMSGGSRVALGVGLSSPGIAGVFASSAGYPDSTPRRELPFPVFETAGTEDFNYLEMRAMDQDLKSPHRLAIFEGGHQWPSPALATEGVEWMEILAMKSGAKPLDRPELDAIFKSRAAKIDLNRADAATLAAANAMVEDFTGLEDIAPFAARAKQLQADPRVKNELKQQEDLALREQQLDQVVLGEENLLPDPAQRAKVLSELRERWKSLSEKANGPADTPERRMARRVVGALSMGPPPTDPDYRAIVLEYGSARPGRSLR